jgi:putative methyltransferase (TIGR04325 family)
MADDILAFEYKISAVPDTDVIIASSSIQYCPNPYEILQEMVKTHVRYIIFDRTGGLYNNRNLEPCRIQYAKKTGYKATMYPRWFLNWLKFKNVFEENYNLVDFFASGVDGHLDINGFVFMRKT